MGNINAKLLAEKILMNLVDYQTEEYAPDHYDKDVNYLIKIIKDLWYHNIEC